jgi:broad specificity phosphatase PhoE
MNVGDLFIGQRSNPEILPIKESDYEAIRKIVSSEKFNVYSSQSKRAIQTAEKFFESSKVNRNALLNEIDYGLVDGKNLEFLKNKWPEIIKEWSLGNDPRFPEGENYSDLRKRFKYFLDLLSKKDENAIVFTHNVFLRCLIGEFFKIPNNKWHMIRIPHVEPMQVLLLRRHFYINVTQDQLKEMFKDL